MISSAPLTARASASASSSASNCALTAARARKQQPRSVVVSFSSSSSSTSTTSRPAARCPGSSVVSVSSVARARTLSSKSSKRETGTFAVAAASSSSNDDDDEARFADDYDALTDAIRVVSERLKDKLNGTPIYLVGMMGSGKSTVGKLIGAALRYQFFDTDQLIEAAAGEGATVAAIFESEGEDSFREAETATLQALLPYTSVVVATGGGAVTRRGNWGLMQHGVVCWLDGPAALLAARAAKDGVGKRPLLANSDGGGDGGGGEASSSSPSDGDNKDLLAATTAKLSALLEKRKGQYAIADVRVPLVASSSSSSSKDGDGSASPALVAWRLLRALERRIDGDAAQREEDKKFEIVSAEDVSTMRVMPAKGGGGGGSSSGKGNSSKGGGKGFGRKSSGGGGGGSSAPAA